LDYANTPKIQEKVFNELLPTIQKELERKYPSMYNDLEFAKTLTKAILERKWFITINETNYFFDADNWLEVSPDENVIKEYKKAKEAENKANKIKSIENARKEKASNFAEQTFPKSLTIRRLGNSFYINIPSPVWSPITWIISKIQFSSEDNAKSFIEISKKYIIAWWYKKENPYYTNEKTNYLNEIQKLFYTSSIIKTADVVIALSKAISTLACFNNHI